MFIAESVSKKLVKTGKVRSKNMAVSCTNYFVFYQCGGQAHKVHETTTFLLVTLPNIHRFKKKSLADSAIKPFLIFFINNPTTP